VGAAVGVAEGGAVGEGDASCARAPNAKHSNSRAMSIKAARRARNPNGCVISQWLGSQSSL